MVRGRKPKIDWELYKDQLLQLKAEGKSLNDISRVLFEKLGVAVTAARVSQKFKEWKQPSEEQRQVAEFYDEVVAISREVRSEDAH